MITLGIDTSASGGGVAVCRDDETLTEAMIASPLQHAEELLPLIERALGECKVGIQAIDLVGVNTGPGSFTGLRIGLATAKGICQAAGIPLAGVDSWTLYREQTAADGRVCVAIENRRDLYYAQWFIGDRPLQSAGVMSGDEIVERVRADGKRVLVVGSGAKKLRDRLKGSPFVQFVDDGADRFAAAAVAKLAMKRFSHDQLYDLEPAYVEPVLARMSKQPRSKRTVYQEDS